MPIAYSSTPNSGNELTLKNVVVNEGNRIAREK